MSFEGHYQILCRNGHQHTAACGYGGYGDPIWTLEDAEAVKNQNDAQCDVDGVMPCGPAEGLMWNCPDCSEVAGWYNLVDDTNCDAWGQMDLVEVTPQETQDCNLGHTHITKPATYRVGHRTPYAHHYVDTDAEADYTEDHGQYMNGGLK